MSNASQPVVVIGDVVVTMSYPGLFTVLDVAGDEVTIGNAAGEKRVVRSANVRRVQRTGDTEA